MKKSRNLYIAILFFTIIVSLLLTALRTVALVEEFEASEGYYAHGAVLPPLFAGGAVAAVLLLFIFALIMKKRLSAVSPVNDSPVIVFTSALISFMIVAVFIFGLFNLGDEPSTITLMTLILAVPAALYPLIGIALPIKSKNGQIMLAVFMLLWLFAATLSIYFKSGIAINNPNRSLELAAVALFLFFFVYECRYTVGTQTPWLYIFFGLSSIIVSGMYTLPNIILVLMKLYPDTLDVTFEFICAVLWIYVLLRMCIYSECFSDNDDPVNEESEENVTEDLPADTAE